MKTSRFCIRRDFVSVEILYFVRILYCAMGCENLVEKFDELLIFYSVEDNAHGTSSTSNMTTNDDPTKASSVSASFLDKLQARIAVTNSFLCVGLDPSDAPSADAAFTVCRNLIDETYEYAVCYKPNAAFFERLGTDGHSCLQRVCDYIVALPNTTTPIPILLDVKRGDIGSTAAAYAKAAYDLNVDAVTLSPLMGWDSVEPFVSGTLNLCDVYCLFLCGIPRLFLLIFIIVRHHLADPYQHKAAFLLCKTSNPGSQDLLNLPMQQGQSLYETIAKLVGEKWSQQTTAALGLVVGATDPGAIAQIRKSAGPDVWILAPGVGAQGGNLEEALQAAQYQHILIPVSRGIARADSPKLAAQALSNQIKECVARYREQKKQQASESSSGDSSLRESIQPYQKEFIEFSLQLGVLKFGTFVLKSGRTSPYFFNAGMFCTGQALFRLAKAYAQTIMSSPLL